MTEKRNNDLNVPTLRFPGFTDEWKQTTLGELCERIGDGLHGTPLYEENTGYYFINGNNLINGNITCSESTKQVAIDDYLKNDKNLNEKTVLISINGTIGNIARYNGERVMLGKSVAYLTFKTNRDFYYHLISSNRVQNHFKSELTGSTIKNLSLRTIRDTSISYPTTEEQNKISKLLSLIEQRIATQNKIIEQLESLIKAIGQVLFNQDRYEFNHFKLGEICEIKKGEQINGSELTEFGKYPVINGGITPSGFHSKYNCNAETITISEGGNSCGFVQFNKDPFWSGGHCYSLNSVKAFVLNKYLFYYLKYSESKIMSLRVGSGLPNIQRNAICNFEVLIPNEQTQILSTKMLDAIYEKRSYEIVLLNLFKNQKQYLLSSMFK